MTVPMYALLLLALLAANLPFFADTRFFFMRVRRKGYGMRCAEWFAGYLVTGAAAYVAEWKTGSTYAQGIAFYAVTLIVFAASAAPGFLRCFYGGSCKQSVPENESLTI